MEEKNPLDSKESKRKEKKNYKMRKLDLLIYVIEKN